MWLESVIDCLTDMKVNTEGHWNWQKWEKVVQKVITMLHIDTYPTLRILASPFLLQHLPQGFCFFVLIGVQICSACIVFLEISLPDIPENVLFELRSNECVIVIQPKGRRNQRRELWADMRTLGWDEQNSEGMEQRPMQLICRKRRGDGCKMYLEK